MHFIASILFAVPANLDNFIVGISYGIKKVQISFLSNLLIALITSAGTFFSITLGNRLASLVPAGWARFAGSGILILLGSWYIIRFYFEEKKKTGSGKSPDITAETTASSYCCKMSLKETFTLGLALMLNNAGLGISASITGLHMLPTIAATFTISILFLLLGNKIGRDWISMLLEKYASPASGLLIILLGIYEIFI